MKWAGQYTFLLLHLQVESEQDDRMATAIQEFQAAYNSHPKYIIQEDPLDGAVHIGRLIWPFLGETPTSPGACQT